MPQHTKTEKILNAIVSGNPLTPGGGEPTDIHKPTTDPATRRIRSLARLERLSRSLSIEGEGGGILVFPTGEGLKQYGIIRATGNITKGSGKARFKESELDEITRRINKLKAQAEADEMDPRFEAELDSLERQGAFAGNEARIKSDRLSQELTQGIDRKMSRDRIIGPAKTK